MKKYALGLSLLMFLSLLAVTNVTVAKPQLTDFEIVIPWGLDSNRGKIIKSMVDNSTIAGDYNFVYTQVGGGPSDRDGLTARFLAGDYPNMLIVTQDWYTEFSEFGVWHNFAPEIQGWTNGRSGWRLDIPTGWWSILDREAGTGLGSKIYALPMFGQSILPYLNTDHFTAAGMDAEALADDWTMDEFMSAAENLSDAGYTPFAMVGAQISDLAYMNYMMGSTDDYITANTDPASVYAWGPSNEYGTNGSLSVNGFARYLKLKGEGWVQSSVDTTDGGMANALFTAGNASMVFCGPWGTGIFEKGPKTNFTAANMPYNENMDRSTITGGGISLVPIYGDNTNVTTRAAAVTLAQDLLEDEAQMKTVENWIGESWRIPVRTSVTADPWFTAYPNRTNFLYHVESQSYAYAWGKQHPKWIEVHESVMMPGYKDALLAVDYNTTGQDYTALAQAALDDMAYEIQTFYLVNIPTQVTGTTIIETVVESGTTLIVTQVVTSVVRAPGFTFLFGLAGLSIIIYYKRRDKK